MATLKEYVARKDQLLAEDKDPWYDAELRAWRDALETELLVRNNIHLLTYPDGHSIQCEIAPGWFSLVGDCLAELANDWKDERFKNYRLHFVQIKEKFGGLRMYYNLVHVDDPENHHADAPDFIYEAIRTRVASATEKAGKTCEDCGEPGDLSNCGGWVQTLCSTHARMKAAK
jgi:hypothetical protein